MSPLHSSPPQRWRTRESVGVNVSALLATIAVGGTVITVVIRPASAFARQCVSNLDQARARTGIVSSRDTTAKSQELRALWLLTPISQGTLAAVLCAAALTRGAAIGTWGEAIVVLPLVALLGIACSVGTACHRLPNHFLAQAAMWVGTATLTLGLFNVTIGTPLPEASWAILRSILHVASARVIVEVMVLLSGPGIGLGGAKLCAALGPWPGYLGETYAMMGVILGFLISGFIVIALIACCLVDRKTFITFGPYLSLGA